MAVSVARAAAAAVLGARDTAPLAARLCARFDARDCILTDSGTSALVLAIRAAVPPGTTIAFPGYICIDVVAAALFAGVRVTLYDVDPETLSPDLDSVESALRAGARALFVAPLFGYAPDMPRLAALAAQYGVPLLEDAAQAAGGTLAHKRLGAFGDLSILSFGRGKGMTTGSGGALLLRGTRAVDWARGAEAQLRAPRRGFADVTALAALWVLARPTLYSIPASIPALKLGEMVYRPAHHPRAISTAAASALGSSLAIDDAEVRRRREHAAALLAANSRGARFQSIRALAGSSPGYLRLPLVETQRSSMPQPHLGVLRGYPITLDEHPETQRVLADARRPLPGARALRDRLVTLPTHSRVGRRDLARLIEWLGGASDSAAFFARANEAM